MTLNSEQYSPTATKLFKIGTLIMWMMAIGYFFGLELSRKELTFLFVTVMIIGVVGSSLDFFLRIKRLKPGDNATLNR